MLRRAGLVSAISAVVIAVFIALRSTPSEEAKGFRVLRHGKANTVLFLTNSHPGLRNPMLATAGALLTQHPDIDVHLGSFAGVNHVVSEIQGYARQQSSESKDITFHLIPGKDYADAVFSNGRTSSDQIHKPGFRGMMHSISFMDVFMFPWTGPDYLAIYERISALLEEVNPGVVVIEPGLTPALDAVRHQRRNYAVLSANTLKEVAPAEQGAALLYKLPVPGSGYQYPVPWHQIPANIFLNLRLAYQLITSPRIKALNKWLAVKGLNMTNSVTEMPCNNVPVCISQSLMEAEFPMVIPNHVHPFGPIVLSSAPAEVQDPDVYSWMQRAPTILINMGSVFKWDPASIKQMALALVKVLEATDVQVLWKLRAGVRHADNPLAPLESYISSRRVRVHGWIKGDPAALMETGNVVASVHHGGASSFYEAVAAGVPHIILAQWVDLYDFATRAEYVGIGVWGNKKNAPGIVADEVAESILGVIGNSTFADSLRTKAREIGDICKANPGRNRTAKLIADLARAP